MNEFNLKGKLKNYRQLSSLAFSPALLLCISFCLLSLHETYAQSQAGVRLLARSDGTRVQLRWAPEDPMIWKLGNQYGYRLRRMKIKERGALLPASAMKASRQEFGPFRLAGEAAWEALMASDSMAILAAAAIFAGQFEVASSVDATDMVAVIDQIEMLDNRFGYSLFAADHSFAVAKAMALGYIDENVEPGVTYLYEVSIDGNPQMDTGRTSILVELTAPPPAPEIIEGRFEDRRVILDIGVEGLEAFYSSYNIYRAEGQSEDFRRINSFPVLFTNDAEGRMRTASYVDSLEANFVAYRFRIAGNTPFGDAGPFSNTVHGSGLPGPISLSLGSPQAYEIEDGKIQLTWKTDEKWNENLRGWQIYRQAEQATAFELLNPTLLPPEARSFTDEGPTASNYYFISAIDENRHRLSSTKVLAQLDDRTPPIPPVNLQGQIDSNGVVTISWEANPEDDLLGYRVYRSFYSGGEFFQLTRRNQIEVSFTDTIAMDNLTDTVFYKVMALDLRENFSAFSGILALLKPDIIPPAAPVIRSFRATELGVEFSWVLSMTRDVVLYRLERKSLEGENWLTVLQFDRQNSINQFRDVTGSSDTSYLYRLTSIDDAGLRASSPEIMAKKLDRKVVDQKALLSGTYLENPPGIELSWLLGPGTGAAKFYIYRSTTDLPMMLLKIENENICQETGTCYFLDQQIEPHQQYQYKVLVKHSEGRLSGFSNEVEVSSR